MHGLRIFVDQYLSEPPSGFGIFYSQRADGPLYRWCFAEGSQQWWAKRMTSTDLETRELSLSKLKNVPDPLQETLKEHYQE